MRAAEELRDKVACLGLGDVVGRCEAGTDLRRDTGYEEFGLAFWRFHAVVHGLGGGICISPLQY